MNDNIITLGVFSVSKVISENIFESKNFIEIRELLKEKYKIYFKFPLSISGNIEGITPKIRADQLHELFQDDSIDMLWAFTGGSASNEILEYLNFELIRKSHKSIIGYSDVSVLLNALYTQTGVINFLGPNIKTLIKGYVGTLESIDLLSYALKSQSGKLKSFSRIYDISINNYIENESIRTLIPGKGEGIGVGGNLSSICLLIDTLYLPSLKNKILLLEECDEFSIGIIRRNLFRLRYAKGFKDLKGIIFGHLNKNCYKNYNFHLEETLKDVFGDLKIPIVINAGHGHIFPMQTLPIGYKYIIDAKSKIPIIEYIGN